MQKLSRQRARVGLSVVRFHLSLSLILTFWSIRVSNWNRFPITTNCLPHVVLLLGTSQTKTMCTFGAEAEGSISVKNVGYVARSPACWRSISAHTQTSVLTTATTATSPSKPKVEVVGSFCFPSFPLSSVCLLRCSHLYRVKWVACHGGWAVGAEGGNRTGAWWQSGEDERAAQMLVLDRGGMQNFKSLMVIFWRCYIDIYHIPIGTQPIPLGRKLAFIKLLYWNAYYNLGGQGSLSTWPSKMQRRTRYLNASWFKQVLYWTVVDPGHWISKTGRRRSQPKYVQRKNSEQ